jgi:hypothetical protein
MLNVSVIDDRCGMLERTGGDVTNPGTLDVGEVWSYACATRYDTAGTYLNTAVAFAGSTVDGRTVTAAPVSSRVVVSAAPPASTSATTHVTASVPPTLALSLGPTASFGPFVPGKAMDYLTSTPAAVTSTAGEATLSVADRAASTAGHLVNGGFVMPQEMQVAATSDAGMGGGFALVGGPSLPTALLRYTGPVTNDLVTVRFRQPVAATDALRTGTYSATLIFTLSTSQP